MEKKSAAARIGFWAALILLAGLTAAVYSNSLHGPFIFDDLGNIQNNPNIRAPLFSLRAFTPPTPSGIAGRPLVQWSLALNYSIGGLNPKGYHVFNITVHVIGAFFLFGILRRSFASPRLAARFGGHATLLAFFASLIWAAHPLQTQAVTYVIQRCESLMGMFFLGVFYLAIRGFFSKKPGYWHFFAVLLFFLGAGVKEVIAVCPALVFLYEIVIVGKKPKEALAGSGFLYAGFAAGLLLLGILVLTGGRAGVTSNDQVFTAAEYLVSQPLVIARYVGLAFFPAGQCIDYGWGAFPLSRTWPYGLAVLAVLALTAFSLLKKRPSGLLGAWFFLILAPTSSFIPVPDMIFEHRMYLPLAAIAVLFVAGSFYIAPRRPAFLIVLLCLWTLASAGLGLAAHKRNGVYSSDVEIWTDTVKKAPNNSRVHANLGMAFLKQNRPQDAIASLSRSLMLNDKSSVAWYDLGNAWAAMSNYDKAAGCYMTSLGLYPYNPKVWLNLGNSLLYKGQPKQAAECYKKVLLMVPDSMQAKQNLGIALSRMQDAGKAPVKKEN